MNYQHGRAMARRTYVPPTDFERLCLNDALRMGGRKPLDLKQLDMLRSSALPTKDIPIYVAGNVELLGRPTVSIVGTREVSDDGRRRASKLAKELCAAGVVVMSGLAKGVDTASHKAAVEAGGNTVAVIGTPLEKAYPAENAALQEWIYNEHLLVSPFAAGERTFKASFPKRNRVMAALSDATVIVEASDTSGTLHQAAECGRLGRWLFILQSVVDNPGLTWPRRYVGNGNVAVLSKTSDIIDAIGSRT